MPDEPKQPTPPTGPEMRLGGQPKGGMVSLDPKILDAINTEASKNAPSSPAPDAQPAQAQPSAAATPSTPTATAAAAPEPQKAKEKPAKAEGIKELREAYERRTAEVDTLNNSLTATTKEKAEAMTKLAKSEEEYAKATKRITEDLEPRAKRLEETEKRLQEREELIKVKDYQASREYHEAYVKPLAELDGEVNDFLSDLHVNGPDGNPAPATKQHWAYIMAANSANEASARAKEMFGPDLSAQAVNLRYRMLSLHKKQQEGLKNSQTRALEWEKENQIRGAQHREQFRARLMSEAQRLAANDPDLNPSADDNEAIAALSEGQKLADLLLNGSSEISPEQMTTKIAEGRTRIIKSHVQDKRIAKLTEKLNAAESQLKAYQKSEPTVETRPGDSGIQRSSNWERLAQEAAKLATGTLGG